MIRLVFVDEVTVGVLNSNVRVRESIGRKGGEGGCTRFVARFSLLEVLDDGRTPSLRRSAAAEKGDNDAPFFRGSTGAEKCVDYVSGVRRTRQIVYQARSLFVERGTWLRGSARAALHD